jgi:hypothetical protein
VRTSDIEPGQYTFLSTSPGDYWWVPFVSLGLWLIWYGLVYTYSCGGEELRRRRTHRAEARHRPAPPPAPTPGQLFRSEQERLYRLAKVTFTLRALERMRQRGITPGQVIASTEHSLWSDYNIFDPDARPEGRWVGKTYGLIGTRVLCVVHEATTIRTCYWLDSTQAGQMRQEHKGFDVEPHAVQLDKWLETAQHPVLEAEFVAHAKTHPHYRMKRKPVVWWPPITEAQLHAYWRTDPRQVGFRR